MSYLADLHLSKLLIIFFILSKIFFLLLSRMSLRLACAMCQMLLVPLRLDLNHKCSTLRTSAQQKCGNGSRVLPGTMSRKSLCANEPFHTAGTHR